MKPEVLEHRIKAERALGKPLPDGSVVHHLDLNRGNNKNKNLVICENRAYHHFIHVRQRAKNAGAPLHWRKCGKCKKYDDPKGLIFKGRGMMHPSCKRAKKLPSNKKTAGNRQTIDDMYDLPKYGIFLTPNPR